MTKVTIPTLKELLEAGVHFGHQTRRWHPSMSPYIFTKKKGIHVFDLEITQQLLTEAVEALTKIASTGKPIVFVCTKRQAKQMVVDQATDAGAMYVTNRWLGGTLTNFETVQKSLHGYKQLIKGLASETYDHLTKRERSLLKNKKIRLDRLYEGIKEMDCMPGALVVIDVKREATAVREANKRNVPVVALVDTNCSPKGVDYVIPGNDDAFRSVQLILKVLFAAVSKGRAEFNQQAKKSATTNQEEDTVSAKTKKVDGTNALGKKAGEPKAIKESAAAAVSVDSLKLSNRATNALGKAGIDTLTQLEELGDQALSDIKGLGKKSLEEIKKFLHKEY